MWSNGFDTLPLRSIRRRVGFYAFLLGFGCAVGAAILGLTSAWDAPTGPTVFVHRRLAVTGLLGLNVVGFAHLFYPPAAGRFPGASTRCALGTVGSLGAGLLVETMGTLSGHQSVVTLGTVLVVLGAIGCAVLISGLVLGFRTR